MTGRRTGVLECIVHLRTLFSNLDLASASAIANIIILADVSLLKNLQIALYCRWRPHFPIVNNNEHLFKSQSLLLKLSHDLSTIYQLSNLFSFKFHNTHHSNKHRIFIVKKDFTLPSQSQTMLKFRKSKEQKFLNAVKGGKVLKVQKYLDEGTADLGFRDKIGENALEKACKFGHTNVVKILLDGGADIHGKGVRQMTVLHLASVYGHKKTIETLLDNGANIHDKDKLGETPLHKASKMGYNEILRILLHKGADINEKDLQGQTALHMASLKGHEEAVKILLDNGADIQGKTNTNRTSLQIANEEGHKDVIRILKTNEKNMIEKKEQTSMIRLVAKTFQNHKRKDDKDEQPQAEQTEVQPSFKARIDDVAATIGHSLSPDNSGLGLKGRLSELGEEIDGSKENEDGFDKRLKDLESKAEKLKLGIPKLSHKIVGSNPRVLWNRLISSVKLYSMWEVGIPLAQKSYMDDSESQQIESLKEQMDRLETSFYGEIKDGSLMERFEALNGQL